MLFLSTRTGDVQPDCPLNKKAKVLFRIKIKMFALMQAMFVWKSANKTSLWWYLLAPEIASFYADLQKVQKELITTTDVYL